MTAWNDSAKYPIRLILALCCLPALLLITLWTPAARAQATNEPAAAPAQTNQATPTQAQPGAPPHLTHQTRRPLTIDDRVKAFATALNLSDSQQVAVKRILEQRQFETLRLRQDPSVSGEDRIARLRALQDQTVERIRAVLTDEQKKKYNPLAVREREAAPDRKNVEDWLKASPK